MRGLYTPGAAVAAALTGVGELAYRVAEGELEVGEVALDRLVRALTDLAAGAGLIEN